MSCLPTKSYSMLGGQNSKSLVGPMCMPIVWRIAGAIFAVFSESFYSNSFSRLLIV